MSVTKAYEEIIDFIAVCSPTAVVAFRPSENARARVADLLAREKAQSLSTDEALELDDYVHLEHLMRLAKARAHQYLAGK